MNPRAVGIPALVTLALVGCGPTPIDAIELTGSATKTTGLVAHWAFDEESGALAHDDSGNAYHGHLVGGQWVKDGRFGGGLHLSRGDFVAVNGFQDAGPDWTVSAWFHLAQEDVLPEWSSLVSTEIYSRGGWLLYIESSGTDPNFHFEYGVPDGGRGYEEFGCCSPKQAGVWYHLTAVTTADASLTLYVGAEVRITSKMKSAISPGDPTLYFGRWIRSDMDIADGPGFFSGVLDDVSIYARALGPDEVARIDRAAAP